MSLPGEPRPGLDLATVHVTRRQLIGEKEILVLDNLFAASDLASTFDFLRQMPFRLNDIDTEETAHVRHWKADLPLPMATNFPVFRRCIELACELMPFPQPLVLQRIYANLNLHGDIQFAHTDCRHGVTALYYANSEWNEKWMGETVFCDDNWEPLYVVAPKPGRLVLFHGNIPHRGGVPSRECYQPRISVAFKFEPGTRDS